METKSTLLPISSAQPHVPADLLRPICPEIIRECYAAHYRYVLQVCRRYFRQREDAEDAAAEVFLKLYRVLSQKDETVPFRPWLSQVTGHHCVDKLRRRNFEKNSFLDDHTVSDFADRLMPSPLSQVLRKEQRLRIRQELIRLPAKYQVPLVLRYYKRMSYSQIARTMNRGLPAVRMMIFRAKEQLRRNLCAAPI